MKIYEIIQGLPRWKNPFMANPCIVGLALFLSSLIGQITATQYFFFRNEEATWDGANDMCNKHGRVLAKVNSAKDQEWFQTLSPYINDFVWIGLKRITNSDVFVWHDSTELDFTNWAEGWPDVSEGYECVRARPWDNMEWETFNCSQELHFLCEDIYYKYSPTVSEDTKMKGLLMGFGVIGGVLFLSCLLLQLPCCRYKVSEKIAHIGLGMKTPTKFAPLM